MDSMPFAFSVHNFISSVGADAGFAAIIGLAVLVLLYFAHARETANLREEAALLAARLQQAEARVAELSRPEPVSAPVPEVQGVQVTDQRLAAAAPFAPAGLAAPALAAATRVVPLPASPAAQGASPADGEPAVAVAASGAAAVVAAAPATAPPAPPPAASPAPPPREEAAVPAAAGASTASAAMPGPATAAGANGGGRAQSVAVPPGPSRGTAGPPGRLPPRPLPPLGPPANGRASTGRRVVIGLAALVLVAVAVVALVALTNDSSNTGTHTSAGSGQTTNAPVTKRAAVFTPATVTVAVLNGTATNQLAHHVAAKLVGQGYKAGKVATAANQTETTTVVAYLPGAKNKADALHVATALNLGHTAVRPIDQVTQQVACPGPAPCRANVVVTVGADLATL